MLEYLAEGTGVESPNQEKNKYEMKSLTEKDIVYYEKSRQNKDLSGNNTLHFVFEIEDLEKRYKILQLLIDEQIGNLSKRNKIGYLPHQIDNQISYDDIPKKLRKHFPNLS